MALSRSSSLEARVWPTSSASVTQVWPCLIHLFWKIWSRPALALISYSSSRPSARPSAYLQDWKPNGQISARPAPKDFHTRDVCLWNSATVNAIFSNSGFLKFQLQNVTSYRQPAFFSFGRIQFFYDSLKLFELQ